MFLWKKMATDAEPSNTWSWMTPILENGQNRAPFLHLKFLGNPLYFLKKITVNSETLKSSTNSFRYILAENESSAIPNFIFATKKTTKHAFF